MSVLTVPQLKRVAVERPITTLSVIAIGLNLPLQTTLLLAGIDLFIGKLAELASLTGTAALITSWIGGWQYVPALISLTVLVSVHRRLSGRLLVDAPPTLTHIPSRSFDPHGTS